MSAAKHCAVVILMNEHNRDILTTWEVLPNLKCFDTAKYITSILCLKNESQGVENLSTFYNHNY